MAEHVHALIPLAVLLIAGVFSTSLLPRLGIPAILGYFLAGVVVGPSATGLVSMTETVRLLAEFGVIFLLFDIGLHFSLKELWASRRDFLGLGPLQWASTGLLIAVGLWQYGFPPQTAALLGGTLALSSTAVALQTIHDRGERGTPLARSATALLIFQDLVAIVLLAIVGAEGGHGAESSALAPALGKAGLAIVAVAVLGRLLRPAFGWITSSGLDEAFTAAALLVVVLTAGLTGMAGLSLPLGAFLGGMLLSESEYCYMVKTELKPFRGLLLGLFFITVGMSLNLSVLQSVIGTALAVALGLLLLKGLLLGLSAALTGAQSGLAVRLGFVLAQGSEFAFVLLALMSQSGAVEELSAAVLTAAVVLSMAATPALAPLGSRLGAALERRSLDASSAQSVARSQHVLINGASEAELTVASALIAAGHAYLIVDREREYVARARSRGFQAEVGDLGDPRLVESIDQAVDVLILGRTTPEDSFQLVRRLRKRRPNLTAILRVGEEAEAAPLRELGAVVCIAPQEPDDRTLAIETLRFLGVAEEQIDRWAGQFDEDPEWEKADKAHAF